MCDIAILEELRKHTAILEEIRRLLDEDMAEAEDESDADMDDYKEDAQIVKK